MTPCRLRGHADERTPITAPQVAAGSSHQLGVTAGLLPDASSRGVHRCQRRADVLQLVLLVQAVYPFEVPWIELRD
jgi:hypothetical protein